MRRNRDDAERRIKQQIEVETVRKSDEEISQQQIERKKFREEENKKARMTGPCEIRANEHIIL